MRRPSPLLVARPRFGLALALLLFLGGVSCFAPTVPTLEAKTASKKLQVFSGEVVSVTDGDTIQVLVNGRARKIRLYGVDTPEKKQAFGMKAKQFTSSLVFGKNVTVTVTSKDRYDRYLGIVKMSDGRILNHELVRSGYAWWYSHYAPHDKELQALEQQARNGKIQLWSDPNAIAPWDFRRTARDKTGRT